MPRRVLPLKRTGHTLQTAAAVFLDRADLSPASRRSYTQTLQQLTHAIGDDRSLETLDGADVETVVQSAWGHCAPATWNRHVATVRSFIAFCRRHGWLAEDAAGGLDRRREPADRTRAIPRAELERLWRREDASVRERAFWRLCYETAGRAAEVLGLNVEDVDLANKRARVRSKGGDIEFLHFQSASARLLPKLIAGRSRGPLFLAECRPVPARAPAAVDLCPVKALVHRRRALLPLPSASDSIEWPASTDEAAYVSAFARFLSRNVAAGDPADDTRATYGVHVATWLAWCRGVDLDVAAATTEDVEDYREALVGAGRLPNTIAIKLTLVRRLYDAAIRASLRQSNPAAGVAAPRGKRAAEDFGFLSEGDLALLLRAVPQRLGKEGEPRVDDLRDKAMLALLSLQVLRTVEIWRANVDDVQRRDDQRALLVRGKGHDRLIFLRADVGEAVQCYLEQRGDVLADDRGVPLFTAVGNRAGGERLSRRGVRKIVDGYLSELGLKRPGVSNHALRHTGATLAYKYTHDLRAVQDLLGHADPRTTARYARVVDKARNNPAAAVPIRL